MNKEMEALETIYDDCDINEGLMVKHGHTREELEKCFESIRTALTELAEIKGRGEEKQPYVLGLEAIAESLIVLRECYGKEKDEKLTTDAIRLKKAVNIVCEELKLHAYASLPDDSVVDFKETVKMYVDEPRDIIDYILKGEKV